MNEMGRAGRPPHQNHRLLTGLTVPDARGS